MTYLASSVFGSIIVKTNDKYIVCLVICKCKYQLNISFIVYTEHFNDFETILLFAFKIYDLICYSEQFNIFETIL